MGNSISNEHQPVEKKRRQSNRSTISNRFSSACSISSTTNTGSWTTSFEREDSQPSILSRLKNKSKGKKSDVSSKSTGSSSLFYSSAQSIQTECPIIDKYCTETSQMSLSEDQHPQVGYSDNQSVLSINSMSTSITTHSPFATYSSELMLKELYMLCETSPERRRDRDRRHRLHYLLKRTWGKNYQIPLENPSLIIDWCCATAVWDIELAFEFPNAQIVGIDYESVTVASLTETIKNFSFRNAMIHQGETGLKEFGDNQVDYIMMRDVWLVNTPACKWPRLFQEIFRILKPGGYIEIYEQDANFKSMGPNLTCLEQWSDRFYEAIKLDRDTNNELGSYLRQAGYTNVKEVSIELPIGEWPDSREMKETGYLQKDITERRFRESKRWYCKFNNLTEREYTHTLIQAIDECDYYKTTVRSFYFSAQKPPL